MVANLVDSHEAVAIAAPTAAVQTRTRVALPGYRYQHGQADAPDHRLPRMRPRRPDTSQAASAPTASREGPRPDAPLQHLTPNTGRSTALQRTLEQKHGAVAAASMHGHRWRALAVPSSEPLTTSGGPRRSTQHELTKLSCSAIFFTCATYDPSCPCSMFIEVPEGHPSAHHARGEAQQHNCTSCGQVWSPARQWRHPTPAPTCPMTLK